jgi:GNAT superfamily N-acetyltransferase
MKIRPATTDDVDHIARIFDASAGWLNERYRPDSDRPFPPASQRNLLYEHLLDTGGVFLAEDPEPVGFSAAIVRDGVWFLSLLWVLPDHHGAGAGTALLDETLAWGRSATAFSVVASPYPVAQLIYLRASMFPLWTQIDLAGPRAATTEPDGMEAISDADRAWVDEIDREVRGTARPEDHAFWQRVARGVILRRDDRRIGYVYGWPDGKIGPGAVADPSDVPLLLQAGQAIAEGDLATVSVPSSNWPALRELIRGGFRPIGSNTFMTSRPIGDASRYISSGGALS